MVYNLFLFLSVNTADRAYIYIHVVLRLLYAQLGSVYPISSLIQEKKMNKNKSEQLSETYAKKYKIGQSGE